MNIPLFDLKRQHQKIRKDVLLKISKAYDSNRFTSGQETQEFEKKFAKLCQTKYALGVHSGTDSLIIALKSLGLKAGDEVITTPCTFSASADCIVHVGATPVFADVDPKTGNLNPEAVERKITPKTKAILLVHLYGIPCDMDKFSKIVRKHNLFLVEDASHAHGSLYKNRPVGSFGDFGCFSLYPSKSLGAIGNAGILTTNKKKLYIKAAMLANHGIKDSSHKYTHHLSGFNKLIDNIQSVVLLKKIDYLQKVIQEKIKIATIYNTAFSSIGIGGMYWPKNTSPSLYVYAIQSNYRQKWQIHFEKCGISTGIYYPIPLHLQPSMKHLGYKKGDFPHAEKFFDQTLSLPLFPELTKAEIDHISHAISDLK